MVKILNYDRVVSHIFLCISNFQLGGLMMYPPISSKDTPSSIIATYIIEGSG